MVDEQPDFTVEVVDFDEGWANAFTEERARIRTAWPGEITVEHIGSTSVPGLASKPTIDLLAVLPDDELADSPPVFEGLGYLYVPASFPDDPRHLFFHRLRGGKRSHHVHVVASSSALPARYLLFRDYLRANPAAAARYAAFKVDLATRYPTDRDRYVDAKPPFVDAMIDDARKWRSTPDLEP